MYIIFKEMYDCCTKQPGHIYIYNFLVFLTNSTATNKIKREYLSYRAIIIL